VAGTGDHAAAGVVRRQRALMRGWGCVTRAQSLPISSRTAPFRATPASLRRREKGSDDSESDSDSEAEAAPRREELVTHNGGCHCGLVKFEVRGAVGKRSSTDSSWKPSLQLGRGGSRLTYCLSCSYAHHLTTASEA
jgi:hypothetical protein